MKSKDHSFITMLILKILGISILLIFGITLVVKGENLDLKSVKVVFSNGSEVNVITTKSTISQILEENHILLADDESTTPKLDENLDDNNKIIISKNTENNTNEKPVITENNIDLNKLEENYLLITEKILTITEEIPFETIQKDVSNNANDTTNKIIQEGQNGIRETKYRLKFKGDVEISREEISSKIIKEPVNKIIQIVEKPSVSSRSTSNARTTSETTAPAAPKVSGSKAEYQAYAKERCQAYGWTENDFNSLVALWNRESGWNPYSKNKYSGAYGIPQALPGSKMASAGSDYLTNYKTQINWGLNYIKGRYGSPSKAYAAFKQKGWY